MECWGGGGGKWPTTKKKRTFVNFFTCFAACNWLNLVDEKNCQNPFSVILEQKKVQAATKLEGRGGIRL